MRPKRSEGAQRGFSPTEGLYEIIALDGSDVVGNFLVIMTFLMLL